MNIAKLLANIFFIAAAHAAFSATVSVDWNKGAGKIKPLHGVNNSPGIFGDKYLGTDPTERAFYRAFRDLNPLNDLGIG